VSISDLGVGNPVYETVKEKIHHHLVCLNCKWILEIEDQIVAQLFEKIQKDKNFKVQTNHLVLYGYCQTCQKENS
jgi:Fur family ferric uptake transcriptional regulator